MMEHPCPLYTTTHSLLTEALSCVVGLLDFFFSDALEDLQVLNVDLPLSQFHSPLVLENTESKGYSHPSGSYDGSQLRVGVVVGYY
jgi:hypothetical protein